MNIAHRLHHQAALFIGALLLSTSLNVRADDLADANKLFRQGQQSQAMDKINSYLADKPKDAQGRFLKGLILTEQGKTAEAIKLFSALTEEYPELPEPYNNLAVLYAGQGQYDKAKMALEMAIRTHPSYATAHENLGDIYAKMASQAYDRALQLDRSNSSTQTKLAMIQDLFAGGARPKSKVKPAPIVTDEPVATSKPNKAAPRENTAASSSASDDEAVLKTVDAWAAAWSAKNVKKYLSFYADDFVTPNGESRADWSDTRRERISKPKSIEVSISDAQVSLSDDSHATVKFRQSYRASHLKTSGNKVLTLVKTGGKWLIQEERAH